MPLITNRVFPGSVALRDLSSRFHKRESRWKDGPPFTDFFFPEHTHERNGNTNEKRLSHLRKRAPDVCSFFFFFLSYPPRCGKHNDKSSQSSGCCEASRDGGILVVKPHGKTPWGHC